MGEAGKKPRWTPRRVVRWTGAVAITTALLLALFGAYGPPRDYSVDAFWAYWTIFIFFLMGAIGLAMIDAMITIMKFRKEHADLRTMGREAMTENQKRNQETDKGDPNA
jgi:hypothetical protein